MSYWEPQNDFATANEDAGFNDGGFSTQGADTEAQEAVYGEPDGNPVNSEAESKPLPPAAPRHFGFDFKTFGVPMLEGTPNEAWAGLKQADMKKDTSGFKSVGHIRHGLLYQC